jgi:hypothetical protein
MVLAILLGLTSCWSGYAGRASVHAELLASMASKLVSMVDAGRPLAVERMGEYVYPAQRARQFLQSYSGYAELDSHRRLSEMTARYETLIRQVDAARARGGDMRADVVGFKRADEELRRLAAEIRQALAEGQ